MAHGPSAAEAQVNPCAQSLYRAAARERPRPGAKLTSAISVARARRVRGGRHASDASDVTAMPDARVIRIGPVGTTSTYVLDGSLRHAHGLGGRRVARTGLVWGRQGTMSARPAAAVSRPRVRV